MPRTRTWTDEALADAVAGSRSAAETLRTIGLTDCGGNYATIAAAVGRLGLDTSHWLGRGWARGLRRPTGRARALDELLTLESPVANHGSLERRLLRDGRLSPCCSGCGLDRWLGRELPLELDHVNGDRRDCRLENRRLLCPNCHALTPTYRGRNVRRRAVGGSPAPR